jgi:putative spermidine/putrescine transport system ATP-binding protein
VGVLTRYVVELDAGGELVVSRQNAEAPAGSGDGDAGVAHGDRVRIAWRAGQAFTIPQSEASQDPAQEPASGEGLQ